MRIFAHRGAAAEAPENTLAAFGRAIELGSQGIELDVWLSRDGIPVVIHDETVDRTTNGSGRVAEFTMRELRMLDAGGGESVPSLGQVLAIAANRVSVNIDVKDHGAVQAVLNEINEHPIVDVFVSAENEAVLHAFRRESIDIELYPLFEGKNIERALDVAREIGARGVSVSHDGLTEEAVRTAHALDFDVWVWTVDDPDRAGLLAGWGVDALCTNNPRALIGATLD